MQSNHILLAGILSVLLGSLFIHGGVAKFVSRLDWRAAMRLRRTPTHYAPVLLVDPQLSSAVELATQLQSTGFPTRIEANAAAAQAAVQEAYFATLIVMADPDDAACLDRLDELRRKAPRSWMIVVSQRCDTNTCALIHRHGGDACMVSPVSIEDLTKRLIAFQRRARPEF